MPLTPVYGFSYEAMGDQPGHSLHGGSAGTEPILAEQVENELIRVDQDIEDAGNRYLGTGWHDITPLGGQVITGETIFQIPPQEFDMIQINFRGNLDDEGIVNVRVNNDLTEDLHRRFRYTINAQGFTNQTASDGGVWLIADWGSGAGCTAWMRIYNTHLNSILAFEGGGTRVASGLNPRRITASMGSINANRILSSLRINATNANINTMRVWIEGHKRLCPGKHCSKKTRFLLMRRTLH